MQKNDLVRLINIGFFAVSKDCSLQKTERTVYYERKSYGAYECIFARMAF